MVREIFEWWQFNFWLGLVASAIGLLAIAPFLLSKRFRKWFSRYYLEPEGLGILLIGLAIVAIGLYNRLSASGA